MTLSWAWTAFRHNENTFSGAAIRSLQNTYLDAAFLGNPFLGQDEKDAFQNGRNLASLTVAVHAVSLLKQQGLSELAAHTLDIKHNPYDDVVRRIDKRGPMDLGTVR